VIKRFNIRLFAAALVINFSLLFTLHSQADIQAQDKSGKAELKNTEDYSNLKVTELHYHPRDILEGIDTISGKKFEFIEFKNIGETSLDLSGIILDSAVHYTFPLGAVLDSQSFFVIVSNPSWFYEFYKKVPTGNFQGNFSNSSEQVLLTNALGEAIINFTYYDESPWPARADGDGFSMVSSVYNPTIDPNDPYYWRASLRLNGSPFKDDDGIAGIDPGSIISKGAISIYPNPATDHITIHIETEENYRELNLRLYNVYGKMVYESVTGNNGMINLKNTGLPGGVYLISIETGDTVEILKFIYTP
jgi:hypothetical protein